MNDKLLRIEPCYVKNTNRSQGHSHVLPPEQPTIDGGRADATSFNKKACMRLRCYELLA